MSLIPCSSNFDAHPNVMLSSRWLRLLFTREFGMEDAMVMWDGLFAVDPTFNIALWICVAMLIRIRNQRKDVTPLSVQRI